MTRREQPLTGWVISLDLWGTLLTYGDRDGEATWRITEFTRVLHAFGHDVAPAWVREIVTEIRDLERQQQRMAGLQPGPDAQVTAILDVLGIVADAALLDVLVTVHTHAVLRACPEPIPGAHAAVAGIKEAGAWLVLTSNTLATPPALHRQLMADTGLLEPFDDLLFSGDLGVAKPDRAVFQAVADRSGTSPNRIVHVGNDWRTDVEGAIDAGCHAVFYNSRGKSPRLQAPDIAHLDQLPDLLIALCTAVAPHTDRKDLV
ncbi:HAD family hydrolase [Dactylosporangium darangshiense]|uniref:HAD family hydrolase n=1 Tax=Dactylosporangium darangshiense TaxID=579108 RepID=A0ABP8DI19_9ACTN